MRFDRKRFFDGYRVARGRLSQEVVDAVAFLLDRIEEDAGWPDGDTGLRQAAYLLATIHWETDRTMLPIDERGSAEYFERRYGAGTAVGKALGNTQAGDGARFHGRGFVQLTGRANYRKAGIKVGINLERDPERAKDPAAAYAVAARGMREGWFTGRRIGDYVRDGAAPRYREARQVINGLDHAADIAYLGNLFEGLLTAALEATHADG